MYVFATTNLPLQSESTAAKELLKQINSVLADEKFLPQYVF